MLGASRGLRLVLPSPNGSTLAFQAQQRGSKVLCACLRNASATGTWLRRQIADGKSALILAAGERWPNGSVRFAIEDLLGAGAILSHLDLPTISAEAQLARAAYQSMQPHLTQALRNCASGHELIERGFPKDVDLAAQLDVSSAIPLLEGRHFVDYSSR